MTFVEGEQALSAWMAENAYVSWIVRRRPWELVPRGTSSLTVAI
jgi:hypothetical protein